MAAHREELLIYGYIKEWHTLNNIALPPNDVILLFVSWIQLLDSFDKKFCHEGITLHPEIAQKFKVEGRGTYSTAVGSFTVEKRREYTTYPYNGIRYDTKRE